MNFYAYIPRPDGTEPVGTGNRMIFRNKYKTLKTLLRYGIPESWMETPFRVFTFTNFYDETTFRQVYGEKVQTAE